MPRLCDHKSVGVLISNQHEEMLMFVRGTAPVGIAPVAGHVDDHGGPELAARAEVSEEIGYDVVTLHHAMTAWRANACRRDPGVQPHGHWWEIYRAEVSGDMHPSAREVHGAPMWLDHQEIRELARRTAAHAHGHVSADQFAQAPGLEPVWVGHLHALGLIRATSADLAAIDLLAQAAPAVL